MSATGTEPTLEGFRDFCASKPAKEKYEPWDGSDCALCQYARSLGFEQVTAGFSYFWADGERYHFGSNVHQILGPAERGPFTFGALTARLRSQVAK